MKKLAAFVGAAALLVGVQAHATTTFQVFAADLQLDNGMLMPTSGLVLLVVDSGANGFTVPAPGASVGLGATLAGDDVVVGRFDLSSSGTPGLLAGDPAVVTYGGAITTGDALQLYWFPSLTLGSASAPGGAKYGKYTDAVGIDGSAAWALPADAGATLDLYFLTASQGGSNPDTAGRASFTVVPEPTTAMLVGLGLLGVLGIRRRS
jgi:hypothetical protein